MSNYLCYEDFGAKGDGVTDDFAAIIACHKSANEQKIPVKTNPNATYYIGGANESAIINTDVDFGTSKFIIDDVKLENIKSFIFIIQSEHEEFDPGIKSLKRGQKQIEFPEKGNYFVKVYDDNHYIYIRKGTNMNKGTPTTDCFTVDVNGNISPTVDWEYPVVTRAYARCTDDQPITVRGGVFTTIANQAESFYQYHHRGFLVKRANVTLCNITHYVTGELDHGAPYHGFIRTQLAVNVTIKDCLLTPRFIYRTASKIPGKDVPMGSYDLSFDSSIAVHCENIRQTIDITDVRYWGIYTSNFCKNLSLKNCILSRFDAHQGVSNLYIQDCEFGHQAMNLIGFGEAIIENTVIRATSAVALRGDYGSIWNGSLTIKNCKLISKNKNPTVISAHNTAEHDFGYVCTMPHTVTIEGFTLDDSNTNGADSFSILPTYDEKYTDGKTFAYIPVKTLNLSGIKTVSGIAAKPYNDKTLYKGLEINILE